LLFQFSGGGWYAQNASAVVRVFVNGREYDDSKITKDSRLGQFVFQSSLNKTDVVTASVSGTSLKNEGEFFHEEIEDKMEKEKGLPLSLGRNNSANLLQLGLGIEHNFLERGLDRNQYYCMAGSFVDRSFNSFWANSSFLIPGRQEYDVFNSTLDYQEEQSQTEIGSHALIPLDAMERSSQAVWVGTDAGIFILNPLTSFSVANTIGVEEGVTVRHLGEFEGDVLASTNKGLFRITDAPVSVTKNKGHGLPSSIYVTSVIHNRLLAGTNDAIYYSSSDADPPYEVWFRVDFVELRSVTPIVVTGDCRAMAIRDGTVMASIGNSIYSSTDGKVWQQVFSFPIEDGIIITSMTFFADLLFVGTNKGVYNDRGTARTDTVMLTLEEIEPTVADSQIYVNDLFAAANDLYMVGNIGKVYDRKDEAWTSESIPVSAAHSFVYTSGGRKVALSNNQVFVD
jgi:hypothetical protein